MEAPMKIATGILIAFILVSSSFAIMPPKPGLYDLKTGKSITTGDPLPVFPETFRKEFSSGDITADVVGVGKMAVALVDFPDRQADTEAHPLSQYQSMIFSTGQYPTGSLNDFYLENSYGNYSVEGDAYGWETTSEQYSHFDDGNYGLYGGGAMVAQAAAELLDTYVDFAQFDSDGPDGVPNSGDDDGFVDAFVVIHSGLGGEDSGNVHDIWSHASMIDYLTHDPKNGGGFIRVSSYTIQPEERLDAEGDTLITAISVICHEYGHAIGLPDLYDYSRYTWGIGYWGLMGYGAWGAGGNTPESPAHLCAWSKAQLGWIYPVNISENTASVELAPVETNPVAYKIWRDGIPGSEYFLLENRQQLGFDSPAPGHGLLIWHVNTNTGDILDLEQADGLNELDDGDGVRPDPHYFHDFMGDDADPFPGSAANTLFGLDTNPSSNADNGTATNVMVGNITEIQGSIFADLLIDPGDYLSLPGDPVRSFGCGEIDLAWTPPADQTPDGYNVYRKVGDNNWQLITAQPINDTTYSDGDIIYDQDIIFGVKAVYGELESSMAYGEPVNIFDPLAFDIVIVGDSSTEYLNNWYKMILDSLGASTRITNDILPYCGAMLSGLPALWLVSLPEPSGYIENPDRETAIVDYLADYGGRIFINDGWLTFTENLYDLLFYDYTTCMGSPFIHTVGGPGTFAEGMSFDFPDSLGPSYLFAMGYPPTSSVLLSDGNWCSSVAVVTDTAGYKAVINSQRLDQMLDGPDGTRLEFFDRMLDFFGLQTGIADNEAAPIPENHTILTAYPNPFNSGVRIALAGEVTEGGSIEIYDVMGRLVRRYENVENAVTWDGTRVDGRPASSGIYFARIAENSGTSVKLTLMK